MNFFASGLLAIVALTGHVALWTWIYNRLHASRLPSRIVHKLEKCVVLAMVGSGLVPLAWMALHPREWLTAADGFAAAVVWGWCAACLAMVIYVCAGWIARQLANHDGGRLLANDTQLMDVVATLGHLPLGDRRTRWQSRIPGNQILTVALQHKTLAVRDLPPALDGLRIAQVTDLHMTGQLTREFFDLAVERTNGWAPDIVAITGDLLDRSECVAWIPGTLGRLTSRFGVYAILGNHDQRLRDVARLRQALNDCGIVDLGGRVMVRDVRGHPVLLAGNESPWFSPEPDMDAAGECEAAFSLLLSHSPDTINWARRYRFALMLAGHTHGGQIRFPLVGPVVCPSRYGVRYASGVFDLPPTLMHVSRGLSGVHTLRFGCHPELTLLELRASAS